MSSLFVLQSGGERVRAPGWDVDLQSEGRARGPRSSATSRGTAARGRNTDDQIERPIF